ncbi:MAG: hypothetical protein EXR69_04000 [Myxococcales bacterium]|nr:hypothetical protein [Myxococcales bacterium]
MNDGAAWSGAGPSAISWRERAREPLVGHVLVFCAYLALWTVVSWPLACAPFSTRLVTRQFDLYPSMWLVEAAPGTFPLMVSVGSAWPVHELLARADSYVLLVIGWINHGALSGQTVCSLLAWLGVPISAAVAERCARDGFSVDRPWSLIAGLCYAFSGIAATALLEGHLYHLLNPWLPLIWWVWQRGVTEDGVRCGMVIGVGFAGALFTTAYFGLFALALLVMLAVDAPSVARRVAPGVAVVALPAGLYYLWLFRVASRFLDTDATSAAHYLRMGTVSASQFIGWDPASDLTSHSLTSALPLMGLPLAIGVLAVGRRTRVLPLLLGLGAVLLALGRTWRFDPADAGFDLPVDALLVPQLAWFRFPVRALWLTGLVVGVQAARTLGAIGPRSRWLGGGALLLATVDAVVGPGLPWRLQRPLASVPSAYTSVREGAAVLDLWAQPADRSSGEIEMWARNLTCYYSGVHGHPTPEVCIGTGVKSPREVLESWLTGRILGGKADGTEVDSLAGMGFGGIAFHVDLYRPADAAFLRQSLGELFGAPISESLDGGEHIVVFGVPAVEGESDAVAVYRRIAGSK